MANSTDCTTIQAPVSTRRAISAVQPVRALTRLAQTLPLSDDDLLAQAMQPYEPGTASERVAFRANALFHERTGQHAAGTCPECGALALLEPWARETLARMQREAA